MLLMARALKAADRSMRRKGAIVDEPRPKALAADAAAAPSRTLCTVAEAARGIAGTIPDAGREDLPGLLESTGAMRRRGAAPTRKGVDTGRMAAVCDEFAGKNGEIRAGGRRGELAPEGAAFCIERLSAGEAAWMACPTGFFDRAGIAAGRVGNASRLMAVAAEPPGDEHDESGAAWVACGHPRSVCEDLGRLRDDMRASA